MSKRSGEPLFGRATAREVYPEIEELKIEAEEHQYSLIKQTHIFDLDSLQEEVFCTNPVCNKKYGFCLQTAVSHVYGKREETGGYRLDCRGWQPIGKLRKDCGRTLECKITIKYKPKTETQQS